MMLKDIRMPLIVRVLCGATIGFLFGLYLVDTFFGGANSYLIYLSMALGGMMGIWLFRR